MKNHKKWLLSVILFSTLLLPLGVHAQDGETEVTETETTSLVTTTEETEVSAEETVDSPRSEVEIEEVIVPPTDEAPLVDGDSSGGVGDPTMIFGPDDRKLILDTRATPYRQVVAVYVYKKHLGRLEWNGSGVLIAPNKVLTAAHVIRNIKTNETYDYVAVAPGQVGKSQPYGQITGSTYHFFTSFLSETRPGYSGAKYYDDLAVITLDSSFGSEVGYLTYVDSLTVGQPLSVVGYPQDKLGYMTSAPGNSMKLEEKIVFYRNDMLPGNSGGPVLDNQNRIVAINIAQPIGEPGTPEYDEAQKTGYNTGRRINAEALALIQSALDNGTPTDGVSKSIPIYYLYNATTDRHFYTISTTEKNLLIGRGWIDKGVAWRTDSVGQSVYRLYHAGQQKYLYTSNESEKNNLPKSGWRNEGVAWNGSGTGKVYRFYHHKIRQHLYTSNEAEKNTLQASGWKYEGVAWSVE